MIGGYDWRGGREAMLRFGPEAGPLVVGLLPLFEEANRTRAFMVSILRRLAELGVASVLPDLPGAGESLLPTERARLADMREAAEAAVAEAVRAGRSVCSLAMRSGALLAPTSAQIHWRMAPQNGPGLLRELKRQYQAGGGDTGGIPWSERTAPVGIAGNLVSPELLRELEAAEPAGATARLRIVRFHADALPADLKVDGAPLWRRSEPDNDPALADLLAEDVASWVRACAG